MMRKNLFVLFVLGTIITAGTAVFAEPSQPALIGQPGGVCPVMEGRKAKTKFYVDYEGRRIYLCCRNCVKAFKKHPERYLRK